MSKTITTALCALFSVTAAHADGGRALQIRSSVSTEQIPLEQIAVITFTDDHTLDLRTTGGQHRAFDLKEVTDITITTDMTGIISTEDASLSVERVDDDTFIVTTVTSGNIRLYDSNGRQITLMETPAGTPTTVSLAGKPSGIFLLHADGHIIKLIHR